MRIIEYEKQYKEQVINLLIKVAVKEYGFQEWEKWFRIFENENYIKNNGNCWIALNDNNEVIGTISLKKIDDITAEVKNLYIKKEERRKGISSFLINKLLEFAKNNNYKKLQLDTYQEFKEAIRFYEKIGFEIKEETEKKYIYEKCLEDKISVIVPIYNVEKYLKYCLDSILIQTYKNLEIILVDDGSTDRCSRICDEYALIDKRIKVIHKQNGGLADARNIGLKYSTGEYIGFIDSDDYIYPTFYEELYNMITKYNTDIAECEFLRINIDNIEKSDSLIEEQNKKEIVYNHQNNIQALKLLYGPRLKPYLQKVVVWNKLYKKELFDNIRFPLGKLHEDEYTTFRILYKARNIVSTNKVMHGYMQTNNSIMRQEIKQKRIDDNLDAYIQSSEFFEKLNENEIEMVSRRRYLENCIELAGKVIKGNSEDKESKVLQISNLYKENYQKYMENIKKNVKDKREEEIILLLDNAYISLNKNSVLDENYWDLLEEIINKK